MKKIAEHYFVIGEDEITEKMKMVKNGLYACGDDFFEIATVPTKKDVSTNNIRLILFIVTILLLSFAVLCVCNAITRFNVYFDYKDATANSNSSSILETLNKDIENIKAQAWIWLLGGIASALSGMIIAMQYHKKTTKFYATLIARGIVVRKNRTATVNDDSANKE